MKFLTLLFFITCELSIFNNSNSLFPRLLGENFNSARRKTASSNNKLMIVGFGEFEAKNKEGMSQFKIYLKKFNEFLPYEYLNLTICVDYKNETKKQESTIVSCNNSEVKGDKRDIIYFCSFQLDDTEYSNVQMITKSLKFYNETSENDYNIEINESDIVESSLAHETINKIINQSSNLSYETFYLDKIEIIKDVYILKGNLNNEVSGTKSISLNLNGNTFDGNLTSTEIRFIPEKKTNEHLQGKMCDYDRESKVLIFVDEGVYDLIIYPEPNQYIELIKFYNFINSTEIKESSIDASIGGSSYSLNNLGNYLSFQVMIIDNEEKYYNDILAFGKKQNNQIDDGIINYNITLNRTNNIYPKEIYVKHNSFYFSDDAINFTKPDNFYILIPENRNILEKNSVNYTKIEMISDEPTINSNSFSLDFKLEKMNIININKRAKAYISYIPIYSQKRDEILCLVENQTSSYRIICNPKKDIHTYINTLIINVTVKETTKRLRFLEEKEINKTFLTPFDTNGMIDYFHTQTNSHGIKTGSKKGLSAGAIVGIIFGIIAGIAAVVFALFFSLRNQAIPKRIDDIKIENSSIQMNK